MISILRKGGVTHRLFAVALFIKTLRTCYGLPMCLFQAHGKGFPTFSLAALKNKVLPLQISRILLSEMMSLNDGQ